MTTLTRIFDSLYDVLDNGYFSIEESNVLNRDELLGMIDYLYSQLEILESLIFIDEEEVINRLAIKQTLLNITSMVYDNYELLHTEELFGNFIRLITRLVRQTYNRFRLDFVSRPIISSAA